MSDKNIKIISNCSVYHLLVTSEASLKATTGFQPCRHQDLVGACLHFRPHTLRAALTQKSALIRSRFFQTSSVGHKHPSEGFRTAQSFKNNKRNKISTYSELIGSQFINIRAISGNRLIPEAEFQQQLVLTGEEHVTPFLTEFYEFLKKNNVGIGSNSSTTNSRTAYGGLDFLVF